MMKTKRFLLVAALAAVALTFSACSDDSSDNGGNALGACYLVDGSGFTACIEITKIPSSVRIEDGKEGCEPDGEWLDKCPSDAGRDCKNISFEADEFFDIELETKGQFTVSIYLYGAAANMTANYSCNDIADELL